MLCCSPNVLREYVVQVTEQSKGHLCKVTDVEEVFRRISTVIFSNDPMARALTLRLVFECNVFNGPSMQI